MAVTRFGPDLGEAYRTIAAVKGARSQNRLNDLKIEEAEARPARENLLKDMRQKAISGDQDAAKQLLAVDPKGGGEFIKHLGDLTNVEKIQVKENVNEIGKLSHYVLNGQTPEEQERRYSLVRSSVSGDTQKNLPEVYDPDFMKMSVVKATAMDKLISAPTVRQVGGEDVVYEQGREVERAKRPVKAGKEGQFGLKAGDESLMHRMSVELLGGKFDANGDIIQLDPETKNKAQSIATDASNIYAENQGNITRAESVKRAAKKAGLNVGGKTAKTSTGSDPQNLRGLLDKIKSNLLG